MARFSRSCFSWIWVGVVVCYGLCTSAYGDRKESQPTLVFRIVNDGQVSQEVVDLQTLPLASTMADEVVQLVEWEVEHTWQDREFIKVVIPRALLDPALGHLIDGIGPTQRASAITERLRNFTQGRSLPAQELEALAHFISITSFMFGFMRPAVLHQDREKAKKMAVMTAQMMVRNFETISTPDDSQPRQQKPALLFT